MAKGGNLLLIGGCLAAAGCAASHRLEVRPVGESRVKSTGGSLADAARGQLALGNVGLALESFQALQRQQPDRSEGYEGIADCYEAMGRYDLARTNYEFALAYAPNSPKLLHELAGSLDQLGEHEQAAGARAEATRMSSKAAQAASVQQAAITPIGVPRAASVTVKLPEAHAISAPAKTIVATAAVVRIPPAAGVTAPPSAVREAALVPNPVPVQSVLVAKVVAPVIAPERAMAVSVPQSRVPAHVQKPVPDPTPLPVPVHEQAALNAPFGRGGSPVQEGPRLERASRGEVLLITTAPVQFAIEERRVQSEEVRRPAPRAQAPAAPSRRGPVALAAAQVRWVPLKAGESSNVELLNAARSRGLAAQTRVALAGRGWRKLAIGNAREVRQHSLVLYGQARVHIAASLAAHFRCKAMQVAGMKSVVVLLGRDAVTRTPPPYRRA